MESIEQYVWRWEQTGENLMSVTGATLCTRQRTCEVKEKSALMEVSILVPHETFAQKQNTCKFKGKKKNVPQIGHPKSHENQIDRSPWH